MAHPLAASNASKGMPIHYGVGNCVDSCLLLMNAIMHKAIHHVVDELHLECFQVVFAQTLRHRQLNLLMISSGRLDVIVTGVICGDHINVTFVMPLAQMAPYLFTDFTEYMGRWDIASLLQQGIGTLPS